MPVKNRFAELLPDIIAWRHDFHAHPELQYDVHRTAGRVSELLRSFGVDEVVEGIGQTGVVGVIRGRTDSSGRVIGLRADMDALPIIEATGLDYASTAPGRMHACGHDGHTSMLLGAAQYLAETRNFDGTAIVIFQPAEEGGAGAQAMIGDGLAERWNIQEFYGLHNMPGIPVGHFAIREGGIMAAADEFEITVTGKGGHAAMPNNAVDTLLVAAQIVVAMQSVVSRNVDPLKNGVVSCCVVETDSTAHNVIPQVVKISGTARSLDPDVRELQVQAMRRIAENTAAAFGAKAELDYHYGYPVTVNHPAPTRHAIEVARSISADVDTDVAPLMGGEDFSFMLNARPGAYMFIGNGDTAGLHHPQYTFTDEAIPFGASWLAGMVEARMPAA
ncbi:M20 aminoacylase family protein [Paracoccus sp. S1E-3]|uniref:M20 aminoacylase family protein n=1 Tax=Paracoccus sp. S1E-3 TaxID=2756130 RepID=UPI0015EED0C1|nr:M20 aminoacylase family protein [Paracoccus sp. S1E-3]MBA4492176.1 amidohydrolase [Paracoccus sp. S1E-3]